MPHIHAVNAYLRIQNAAAAIEFYKQAFGAVEIFRLTDLPTGKIGHAELKIGPALVMLSDEFPEYGALGPQSIGGTSVGIHLQVDDADRSIEQAVAAGAKLTMPPQDQFYGERSGKIEDPFGHVWTISRHIEDVTIEEMQRRYDAMYQK